MCFGQFKNFIKIKSSGNKKKAANKTYGQFWNQPKSAKLTKSTVWIDNHHGEKKTDDE